MLVTLDDFYHETREDFYVYSTSWSTRQS